ISHTFFSDSFASSAFSPRAFRGEKVAEGRMRGVLQPARSSANATPFGHASRLPLVNRPIPTPPHPAFGHLLPHKKRGGEGARLKEWAGNSPASVRNAR